ncbi:MAG: N-acetylmuramoyl-L-alanine amidase [candidate division Zixibacteria bacterium]|nr:N-acetylmuramoyl-L-alanine amidase [candidate division Zixibacteria bacterium]
MSIAAATVSAETTIQIVYPKAGQAIGAVDSAFIFGSVSGDFDQVKDLLEVNGRVVPVHRDGGFLAFLPIMPGPFEFRVRAWRPTVLPLESDSLERNQLLAETVVGVLVPLPRRSLPEDTLAIVGDYNPPSGDLVLSTGDIFQVMFQGTPGMSAWFSIPGVVDSVPMSEVEPRQQAYWGESVFGAGAVPDSMMIQGVYSGFLCVPESLTVLDDSVVDHLATPPHKYMRPLISTTPADSAEDRLIKLLALPQTIARTTGYRVSMNRHDYPFTVRFLDSVQILRQGPRLGYFSIFQPQGAEALVVGREGDWYKLKLSRTQFAWADCNSVMALPPGALPAQSRPTSLRTFSHKDHVLVEIGLGGKHPFRIIEEDSRTLRLQLFGVTSNTDWIRYDFADPLVALVTWSQPEDGLYEITLKLTQDVWGYDTYYQGDTFYLRVNRPPERTGYMLGKTIVLDPGHASDPGAIGPTGLTEAEANLGIALALRDELVKKGAKVVMTRSDMSHVGLYDRPVIAKLADADLFISVHNNALPDGVNPFTNHGVSTYYYQPHSIGLARVIHAQMLKATGMPDFGLYYGNLAVARPTQYPAVLVECAFMMLPEQEALLKTEGYRRKVAKAVASGIENFLKEYDHRNEMKE